MRARFGQWLLLLIFLVSLLPLPHPSLAKGIEQAQNPAEKAKALLARLTTEEKIGQLFLVSFKGATITEADPIYALITQYKISGVVLSATNDNFSHPDTILQQTQTLNQSLQSINAYALTTTLTTTTPLAPGEYIPLFIGISQEGGGPPYDQLFNGVTVLPDAMSIGATWSAELSQKVGEVVGKELSALGFNLLFGPALDVLETPRIEGSIDLGTRAFGGDPYWVSVLGSAYIRGVHEGSQGKMAVIAKNFPGNGGADRSPEIEVATVRKSLEQLKTFDLLPFFSVTGNAQDQVSQADGLLAAHIRYQGFQENIRTTTRPISLDPEAFRLLMNLSPIADWRQNGGLMVCENLSAPAVRNFYQLNNEKFDARLVALSAFLSGNDLIHLGNILSDGDPDAYTSIRRVIEFFRQKYNDDPAFAQRVDQAVLRILTIKYRLYPQFNPNTVLSSFGSIDDIGNNQQITIEVARNAATLISPKPEEISSNLPNPPRLNDRLVIFTDVRTYQQCSQCPVQTLLGVNDLADQIKRLYGSQGSGQIWPSNIVSYSFEDLTLLLNNKPDAPPVESSLKSASWIIFAMLNVDKNIPSSQALQRFLTERPSLFQQKKLIVFAFSAPYYLDATDISKLSAFYGLYSASPVFVETAARILFKEIIPQGALPVSVPGIGYDLITATSPDPNQNIPLFIDLGNGSQAVTPQPNLLENFKIGDFLPVRTGIILDHNGNPVPDGTPVHFIINASGDLVSLPQPVTTQNGIAKAMIKLTSSGIWEIRVESYPAKQSDVIRLEIPKEEVQLITIISPTEFPTITPAPSPTPTQAVQEIPPPVPNLPPRLSLLDWLISLILSVGIGYGSYRVAFLLGQVRAGVQSGFSAIIGGLSAYSYLALQLPGSLQLLNRAGTLGVILVTALGALIGLALIWLPRALRSRKAILSNG
ncbi:MAG: hypothetical protein DDG59_06030 [Anaerolineae bacterium]|jgi:beta-N-acetylhexosaminidase|nr:MAG: hypothetical protein DDG59_06030 [Anaerolineae bacterium]